MNEKSPCDLLAARFEKKAADGLRDVKFFLRPNDAEPEAICHEIEGLYEAVEKGKATPLDFGDLKWKESTT